MKKFHLISSEGKHILDDNLKKLFYPPEIMPVKEKVDSTAFFPGGNGIYEFSEDEIDILVIGQDFGTVSYHEQLLSGNTFDTDCATWKNMLKLFDAVCPRLKNRCFFSNVFIGLRKEDMMTGPILNTISDSEHRSKYKNSCITFLQEQIKIIRPRAIITLGNEPIKMLFTATNNSIVGWDGKMKASKSNSVVKAKFDDVEFYCLALLHPSLRNSNLHYRKSSKTEEDLLLDLLHLIS